MMPEDLHQEARDNFYDRLYRSVVMPSGIVEFYPDATLIVDGRGRVAAWNRAMESLTGIPAGEMLGKGEYEYAIPFYGVRKPMLVDMVGLPTDEIADRYTDVVACGNRLEAKTIKAKLKGRDAVLWGVAARLYGVDGEPVGAIESVRDVTPQVLMENKLKASEEKYRLIATSSKDGIITVNSEGIIGYVNPGGERLLRSDARHIVGRHFTDFVADGYKEKAVREFYRGLAGKSIASFEIEAVDESGMRLPVELSGSHLDPDTDSVALVTIRDVSERRRARMELEKAHEELERRVAERTAELAEAKDQAELYLDLMGHDINNMNQSAMGFLELAAETLSPEDPACAFIGRSYAVLKESSRLIGDLRKIQQAADGLLELERTDLDAVLAQVKAECSPAPGRAVTISYEPVAGYVMANQLLNDVFLNIVGNAIKHSTGPLHVEVKARRIEVGGKPCFEVAVEDDGPGIADGRKCTLFSRTGRSSKAVGGGLGLYIVKSLVEGFGGRVWAEDRVPGDCTKGCRFVVVLPAAV